MLSTEAVPFVAAALLAVLGAILSWVVGKRTPDLVRELNLKYGSGQVPNHLAPDGVSKICVWAADCAQSGVALTAPPLSGLLLVKHSTPTLGLAYICVGIFGALVFFRLLFANPDRYSRHSFIGLTPVGGVAIAVNVIMAVIVSMETG